MNSLIDGVVGGAGSHTSKLGTFFGIPLALSTRDVKFIKVSIVVKLLQWATKNIPNLKL